MQSIGDRILTIRKELNMSQKELADKAGITEATLSRYENNLREPKAEIIGKIAIVLGVSTDYLLGRTDIRNPAPDHAQQVDKRLRELLSDPEMLVAFKGLEDMTDEEKEGLITYLETMKVRREKKGK